MTEASTAVARGPPPRLDPDVAQAAIEYCYQQGWSTACPWSPPPGRLSTSSSRPPNGARGGHRLTRAGRSRLHGTSRRSTPRWPGAVPSISRSCSPPLTHSCASARHAAAAFNHFRPRPADRRQRPHPYRARVQHHRRRVRSGVPAEHDDPPRDRAYRPQRLRHPSACAGAGHPGRAGPVVDLRRRTRRSPRGVPSPRMAAARRHSGRSESRYPARWSSSTAPHPQPRGRRRDISPIHWQPRPPDLPKTPDRASVLVPRARAHVRPGRHVQGRRAGLADRALWAHRRRPAPGGQGRHAAPARTRRPRRGGGRPR